MKVWEYEIKEWINKNKIVRYNKWIIKKNSVKSIKVK